MGRDYLAEVYALLDGDGVSGCVDHRTVQRRAWDAENLRVLETKVSVGEARLFRKLCADAGETVYSVLQRYVLECVQKRSV